MAVSIFSRKVAKWHATSTHDFHDSCCGVLLGAGCGVSRSLASRDPLTISRAATVATEESLKYGELGQKSNDSGESVKTER